MMLKTSSKRCFKVNGKLGFKATGDVKLWCSSDTCGPNGKAEIWCQECCVSTSTPSVLPAVNNSYNSLQPMVIASVAFGSILSLMILIGFVYFLSKKFLWRRTSYHDDEAELIQSEELHLSSILQDHQHEEHNGQHRSLAVDGADPGLIQDSRLAVVEHPCDIEELDGQQSFHADDSTTPEKAEFVMTNRSVMRQLSDGDQLPLSQQPVDGEEFCGQHSCQAIDGTAPRKTELEMTGHRVVRQLSYDS